MSINLLLHDPFCVLKDYPEHYNGIINTYPFKAIKQKFNHTGDYLAIGCSDGSIIIYDADTMKLILYLGHNTVFEDENIINETTPEIDNLNKQICQMQNHTLSIQSLRWSSCSRYIISAGKDFNVKLWDLSCKFDHFIENSKYNIENNNKTCNCKNFEFQSAIWDARFYNEKNEYAIVCASGTCIPLIVDIKNGTQTRALNYESIENNNYDLEKIDFIKDIFENEKKYGNCVSLELSEDICIVGTSKGWLMFYDMSNLTNVKLISYLKVCSSSIKTIILSQSRNNLCVNSSDRIIRQYDVKIVTNNENDNNKKITISLKHKYQDVINRLQWNSMGLSPHSGEFLIASAHGTTNETGLFLWDTSNGSLVKIYENAGEELSDIDWDANKMCIVATGVDSGDVFYWSVNLPPKWASLAPDFEEVDEQVEYIEKEDEFDEFDEDLVKKDQIKFENDTTFLDLVTPDKTDVRGNVNFSDTTFKIPVSYKDIIQLRNSIERYVEQ
ncbi:hypothetical protein ACO0SA_003978 [Hanseniaspora valbyensis]